MPQAFPRVPNALPRMTDDARLWLLTAEAAVVLADLPGPPSGPTEHERLRRQVGDADRAAAAAELAELRRRATAKFALADRMFFTRKAFEQATDEAIARYKATRFAGCDAVEDVCCGVGGDTIALAGVTSTTAIDADATLVAYAERNAAEHGYRLDSVCQMVDAAWRPAGDAWHADPDRRVGGRRTSQPESHEPSLATLGVWLRDAPNAAIKLAPAARLDEDWSPGCEREWISRGGECRQQVVWCGDLATEPSRRRATRLDRDGVAATFVGVPDAVCEPASEVGEWIVDPDPAVLASELVGCLAAAEGLAQLGPYLTADSPPASRLLAAFRVLDCLPLDRKGVASWLATRGAGRLEIKSRGVEVDPEALRRRLKPVGPDAATLLLLPKPGTRAPQSVVIAQRADASSHRGA